MNILVNTFLLKTYNELGGYMNKITQFKEFVKQNPSLLNHVKEEKMTWQKFYEMYDIYGGENEVWNTYLNPTKEIAQSVSETASFGDLLSWMKSINLDKMQEGINSVQRVLGVLEDFSSSDNKTNVKPEYKPRPLYKHFED